MRKNKRKPQPFYSDEIKHHVTKAVITGQLTRVEAMQKYNIAGNSTITNWMRILGYTYPTPLPVKNKPLPKPAPDKPEDIPALQKQIKELKQLLHQEQMRSEFYHQIIDTAERELGVAIRKKSDAK